MFLVARLYVSRWKALIVWCVFAFGTAAWSVAALGLWMHGPTVFLLGFALYFSLSALPERGFGEWRLFVCGFLIAFAYIVRPSNAIWVLIFSAYMVWHFRMRAILFMSGAAVVAIPFLLYNISVYESILPSYYEGSRLQFHTAFLEALIANLISPSRGLFFYTPVLIFAIGGAILRIRAGLWRLFDSLLAGGMVAHWLAISAFPHWWGGFFEWTPFHD